MRRPPPCLAPTRLRGSWSPSVQITARVYFPDGTKKVKNVSVGGSSLKLSADKLSSTCSPMAVTFKTATPGPSYKVSFQAGTEVQAELDFDALVEAYQVNDGKTLYTPGNPANGYIAARFVPKSKVTGTLIIDGKSHEAAGHGVFSHVIQSPPQNVARWNYANLQNEKDALILYQYHLPKGKYPQDVVSQGVLVLDNKIIAVTVANHTVFNGTAVDSFSGYHVPKAVTHVWEGTTRAGEPVRVELALKLDRMLDKIDVLAELPFLVRKFIQTFITAPFVYQWLENAEAKITIGGKESTIKGLAFHENTFMSELEQTA
nr:putative cell survival pathways protein [Polyrhizophydium stewartii]